MVMNVVAIISLLSGVLNAAGPDTAEESIQVAIPGQYSKADEVASGDGWWGIARHSHGFTLEATTTTVKAIPALYQSAQEKPSGLSIAVPDDCDFIAILRGSPLLRAGPLQSTRVTPRNGSFLYPGEKMNLTLDSGREAVHFEVRAIGTAIIPEGSPTIGFHNYALILIENALKNTRRQTLVSVAELNIFEKPEILWAGDLDRDGKPDIILDRTKGESQADIALFLSSAASDGELVGLVADWMSLGPC